MARRASLLAPRERPDLVARFRAVVARAVERSDREQREHLTRLRGGPENGRRESRRRQDSLIRPRKARR